MLVLLAAPSRSAAAENRWTSVAYGNGTFVAVAETGSGDRVMTSSDGATWTRRASAADLSWKSVTYGGGLFVAVAAKSSTVAGVMTSPDGVTWTLRTPVPDRTWGAVAYGGGTFVAVERTSAASDSQRVMSSTDGIAWTSRTAAYSVAHWWHAVAYGNNTFVALDAALGNSMTSSNGTTWTERSALPGYWNALTWGGASGMERFVAVGSDSERKVMTSPDGVTWTSQTAASSNNWQSITYGNGMFLAVSNTGTGNRVMRSPDGITWTAGASSADNAWGSVAFGGGVFVAVATSGSTNRVMTSPDGSAWTSRDTSGVAASTGGGTQPTPEGSGATTVPDSATGAAVVPALPGKGPCTRKSCTTKGQVPVGTTSVTQWATLTAAKKSAVIGTRVTGTCKISKGKKPKGKAKGKGKKPGYTCKIRLTKGTWSITTQAKAGSVVVAQTAVTRVIK